MQLEAAVDEVALERLKAEEAERESRAAEEPSQTLCASPSKPPVRPVAPPQISAQVTAYPT